MDDVVVYVDYDNDNKGNEYGVVDGDDGDDDDDDNGTECWIITMVMNILMTMQIIMFLINMITIILCCCNKQG